MDSHEPYDPINALLGATFGRGDSYVDPATNEVLRNSGTKSEIATASGEISTAEVMSVVFGEESTDS